MRNRLMGLAALALVGLAGPLARESDARSQVVLSYPVGEVWATAVRFVRVDRGYEVVEKDAESGYILFNMVEGKRSYKGSLELVPTSDGEGREATRAIFTLPDLPRHFEVTLIDKLAAKLKDERGTPPPAPARKPADADKKKDRPDGGPVGLPRAPTRELK